MIHARRDYQRIQDPEGKIGADEPVMLFRARDVLAPILLSKYVDLLRVLRAEQHLIDSVLAQEALMRKWQRINGCKVPDMDVSNVWSPEEVQARAGLYKTERKGEQAENG